MSRQKGVLREMAAAHNSCSPDRIRPGHEGARQMRARFSALTPPTKLEALDLIEEANRVAVRWQLTATYKSEPLEGYRFEDGRITEDWASRSGHADPEATPVRLISTTNTLGSRQAKVRCPPRADSRRGYQALDLIY